MKEKRKGGRQERRGGGREYHVSIKGPTSIFLDHRSRACLDNYAKVAHIPLKWIYVGKTKIRKIPRIFSCIEVTLSGGRKNRHPLMQLKAHLDYVTQLFDNRNVKI